MCIIAAKPAHVKMPDDYTIENMWYKNPDGAGFMYAYNGKVHILKGFMKLADLKAALDTVKKSVNLDDVSVVLHFRIATHGGVSPANTHPFPVSSSIGMLQKTRCTTTLGVAHNGIIDIKPRKGLSDTMEYILTRLSPLYKGVPDFYENPHLIEMVENAIQSKLCIMNGDGHLYTIGNFETDGGIMYSNTSYKPYTFIGSYWKDKWWADYYWDDYDEPSTYVYKGEKLLRWFDYGEDALCVDSRGHLIDDFEYDIAVDEDGKMYKFDYEAQGFVLVEGGRAYDKTGKLIVAKEEDYNLTTSERIYEKKPVVYTTTKKDKKDKKK